MGHTTRILFHLSSPGALKGLTTKTLLKAEDRRKAVFLGALWHLYALRKLPQTEEGCHSATFRTTIHCRHHLLFYKDGGFKASLLVHEALRWN